MDLLTGTFLWNQASRLQLCTHEPLPAIADIVVIGGGISGAIITNALSKAGHTVVVLDKRDDLALGSTLASTAILQYELDVSLTELSNKIGASDARMVYYRSFKGWEQLCTLAEQFGTSIDFERKPSLCLASSKEDARALKLEADTLNAEGFSCEFLSAAETAQSFSFTSSGALFHECAAQVNPVKLTDQLFKHAIQKGATIFKNTHVKQLQCKNDGSVKLKLQDGRFLSARKVIMASGYESVEFFKPKSGKLFSSYAAATFPCREQDLWNTRAVVWETARPYHYLRIAPGPRIIIGGGDISFRNPFF